MLYNLYEDNLIAQHDVNYFHLLLVNEMNVLRGGGYYDNGESVHSLLSLALYTKRKTYQY